MAPGDDLNEDVTIHLARERPFRLGATEVRPATREVVGPRGREILEPRVMQVLVALARADGEIVTRDDLTASCWEGRVVGEDAITRVISRLRRHSEGVGRDGWTLETITKVGYRLLPAGRDDQPLVTASRQPTRRRALVIGGVGAAVVAGVGGLAWQLRQPRPSPEAQALYEKGREALRQGLAEPTAQAVGFLRAAVAEQPDYAAAWGSLARAYQLSLTFTDPARQPGVIAQAQAAAKRALDLDPRDPEATATLALLTPTYRNWQKAEDLYLRALSLHPREPAVELGLSKLLLGVGRINAALPAAQAAVDGDPYAPYHRHGLGLTLWMLGRLQEAELTVGRALELWPRHYALWFLRLHMLAYAGRGDEALAFARNQSAQPAGVPAEDIELSLKGVRALMSRTPNDIETAAQANMEAARQGVGFAENAMQWLSAIGRLDEAFVVARGLYFDEGFSVGSQRYSAAQGRFNQARTRNTHMLFMPPSVALRADPRFPNLTRDLGLASYWKATGRGPDDPAWARGVA